MAPSSVCGILYLREQPSSFSRAKRAAIVFCLHPLPFFFSPGCLKEVAVVSKLIKEGGLTCSRSYEVYLRKEAFPVLLIFADVVSKHLVRQVAHIICGSKRVAFPCPI